MRSKRLEGWEEVELKEVAEYVNDKTPIENCKINNYISTTNMIAEKGGISLAESLPKAKSLNSFESEDILVSNIRPYFRKIWFAEFDGTSSTDILIFRTRDNYYSKFLYYVLSDNYFFDYSTKSAKGTKMPRGDKKAIMNYLVPQISIREQKEIADTLSSLDDKIELNNKINKNLEEQAQAIFKHWFVDFEFPDENGKPYKSSGGEMVESELGMIPKGWEVVKLKDELKFLRGVEPGSKNYKDKETDNRLPFYRVGEMLNTTDIYVEKPILKDRIATKTDVLVSFDGTVGRVVTGISGGHSTGIRNIYSEEEYYPKSFIYFLFKSKRLQDIIRTYATGTTILHASKSIDHMFIPYNEEIIREFNTYSGPIFDLLINAKVENQKLSQLRDTLLPKLMSGEIRIPIN